MQNRRSERQGVPPHGKVESVPLTHFPTRTPARKLTHGFYGRTFPQPKGAGRMPVVVTKSHTTGSFQYVCVLVYMSRRRRLFQIFQGERRRLPRKGLPPASPKYCGNGRNPGREAHGCQARAATGKLPQQREGATKRGRGASRLTEPAKRRHLRHRFLCSLAGARRKAGGGQRTQKREGAPPIGKPFKS